MSRYPLSRLAALALGAAIAFAGGAPFAATDEDDAAAVARVEDYLNAITTLRANFVQVAADGSIAEGTLYIARPGRLRIEYAPPAKIKMVSDGEWLTYIDGEIGQISQMPLSETPAGVLVRENIRFGDDIVVSRVERDAQILRVTLTRADSPDEGSFTLVFSEKPFELRQWVVVDAQGFATRITLFGTQRGIALDPELFAAPPPFPTGGEMR